MHRAGFEFGGAESRGRDVQETKTGDIWQYRFDYTFEGKPYSVEFERNYPMRDNLIDAVIDNFQIKLHKTILIPGD